MLNTGHFMIAYSLSHGFLNNSARLYWGSGVRTGLMVANLVGFVVGLDGLKPLLQDVAKQTSFMAATFLVLFSASQVCFPYVIIRLPYWIECPPVQ